MEIETTTGYATESGTAIPLSIEEKKERIPKEFAWRPPDNGNQINACS